MKVRELMRREVRTCEMTDNLATVGLLMAQVGCGVVPVVGPDKKVVGIITDRDLCVTLTSRDTKPSEIEVGRVMRLSVYTCGAHQEIGEAMELMREHRVRRLPVVDKQNRIQGLLSLDDIVLDSRAGLAQAGPLDLEVLQTLRAICQHPMPVAVR